MKTSELTGAELDYWVGKAEGVELCGEMPPRIAGSWDRHICDYESFSPSTDWSQGGPIIEREKIWLSDEDGLWNASCPPHISVNDNGAIQEGDTALQAAMRCFVASKYGDKVPDEETKA